MSKGKGNRNGGPGPQSQQPPVGTQDPPIQTPGEGGGDDGSSGEEMVDVEAEASALAEQYSVPPDWILDMVGMVEATGGSPRAALDLINDQLSSLVDPRDWESVAKKYRAFADGLNGAAVARKRAKAKTEEEKRVAAAMEQKRNDRSYWPKGEDLPSFYIKRSAIPCPKCMRILLDSGHKAVVVQGLTDTVANMRCRACNNTWMLPVKNI